MATITVLHNQSFLDIAIQHTGIVFNAFQIALFNNMAISDTLVSGTDLVIPDDIERDTDVLQYYELNNLQPSTALQNLSGIDDGKGIGWMKVGNTFKVG